MQILLFFYDIDHLYAIHFQRINCHLAYFVCQCLWINHLQLITQAQDMTTEVTGWTDVILKDGIVLTLTDGFLAMMQRKVMQIVTLLAVCTEDDALSWSTITDNYTKALAEVVLRVKVITNLELDICKRDFLYAVKRIDSIVVTLFLLWGSISMEVSKHIPTLDTRSLSYLRYFTATRTFFFMALMNVCR